MRQQVILAGAAALAVVVASCTGPDDDATPEATEPTEEPAADDPVEPVTLQMASSYGTLEFTPAVQHFVEQVEALSDGNLSVDVLYGFGHGQAGDAADAEQHVVQAVADGEVDLAWAGTRVFDTLGLASFQALHAPLLVDSYPLQAAIIDSDIPERMLERLDEIGVTGLAVLAGGLRVPIGVDGPLLEPDDFEGIAFQLYRSDVQADTMIALSATPTDVVASERDAGLASGEIDAHEHSLLTYVMRGNYTLAPYIALNVTLWAETQALFANPDVLAGLTDEQVGWLREAAADAAARSAELHDVDAELVFEACEQGARFAEASEAQLGTLREAVESVYADLRGDPLTAELIAQIDALKQTVTTEPLAMPDGCTGTAPGNDVTVAEGADDPSVLNGAYRLEWEPDELVEAAGFSEPWVPRNAGVVILTFADGEFDQVWESGPGTGDNCPGTYAIAGDRLTMVASTDATEWDCGLDSLGNVLVDAAWELTDAELILSDFVLSDEPDVTWWNEIFLGSKPLTRID